MERLKCNPIENMAIIANRNVPCGTCIDEKRKPTGFTKYELPAGQHSQKCAITDARLIKGKLVCTCKGIGERVCASCGGSLQERINVDTMLKASSELAKYGFHQLKAVEHSGPDGGAIQHAHTIKLVD